MTRPLVHVAEVALGRQRSPQHEHGDFMVPYLRSANVGDGHLILDDVKVMNFTPAEQDTFALRSGDVLVTEGSGSRETVGTSAVWHDELPGTVCFQNTLLRIRPRPRLSDGRFLAWWARHAHASRLMASVASGANIFHLSAEELRRLPVPDMTLDQQRRIADFLDDQVGRIDSIIAARSAQRGLVDDEFTSALHSAISGARHLGEKKASNLPWLRQIPSHWGEPRICQVALMGTGHTPSRSVPEYWENCTIPWLTTGDVHRFRHDEIEAIAEAELQISELGLANSAAVLHSAGTVALSRTASAGFSILMNVDMATSQDYATWTCGPRLRPRFLLWCLRAMRSDLMGRLAMGSTHKTIYFPELMSIRIPLPTIPEQDEAIDMIVGANEHRQGLLNTTDQLVSRLTELKRSLITAAVSGEFDVSTADGSGVGV